MMGWAPKINLKVLMHGFYLRRCPWRIVASSATFDGLAKSWQDLFAMPRVFKTSTFSMFLFHFWSTFVHNMRKRQRKKMSETQKSPLGICSGNETALAAFSKFFRSVSDDCHELWLCEYTQDVLRAPHDHDWHLMALRSTFCSFFWQNKTFPLQQCAPSS